jgi:divalent metal cation (Fe/Co/Zn/Cd) transporter
VGAAILSLNIIYEWAATSFENVTCISGATVSEAVQQKLTFLAYRFALVVDGIKSVTACHAVDNVGTEFDLLLPEKMPLGWAHDIAETLRYCCESEHFHLGWAGPLTLSQASMKLIAHL